MDRTDKEFLVNNTWPALSTTYIQIMGKNTEFRVSNYVRKLPLSISVYVTN
jgi:hypothetical protein